MSTNYAIFIGMLHYQNVVLLSAVKSSMEKLPMKAYCCGQLWV